MKEEQMSAHPLYPALFIKGGIKNQSYKCLPRKTQLIKPEEGQETKLLMTIRCRC